MALMTTQNITSKDFVSLSQENKIVFLDFWAAWCGPCRQFGPIFEAASNKYPEFAFAKIDVDAESELAAQFRVSSIPTLAVLHKGNVVFQEAGAKSAPQLEELISQMKRLAAFG